MATTPPYTTLKDELRHISALAMPVAIWTLGLMMMGFVDVLFVARLEVSAELAAVSLGHIFSFSVLVFGQGVLRGLDPFMAQAHGASDRAKVSEHLGRALLFAMILTIPGVILHALTEPLLHWFAQPDEIIPITARYCEALIWGILPATVFVALSQFYQSLGRVMLPMVAIVIANVLNVILDGALVLGVPAIGLESMGSQGCGFATSVVRWVMVCALVILGWRTLKEALPSSFEPVLDLRTNVKVLATGLPIGAQACLEGWAFSVLGLMMGWLGPTELAAHAVVINLAAMTYMVPVGIGAAASTRVGHLIGSGSERWSSAAWLSVVFSVGWMSVMAAGLWWGRAWIADYYTDDAAVMALILGLLPIAAAFQIFDGVQATVFGALRGAGDTQFPALTNMFAYWLIGLPVGYVVGVVQGRGALALWGSVALALMIISVLVVGRLFWLARRGVTRLEHAP